MDSSVSICPNWLGKRIEDAGGSISFCQFMDWALNDPDYGAYATGRLQIGRKGDFVTSPSLGPDFAELLAIQLVDWFNQLEKTSLDNQSLSLIDIGPGEGDLSRDLITSIYRISPQICKRLRLVLVEPNKGMIDRQRIKLQSIDCVPISWMTIEELQINPGLGIVLAHELLDALPVERIIYRNQSLCRQGVSITKKNNSSLLTFVDLPLSDELITSLAETSKSLGLFIPPIGVSDGWTTEWHLGLDDWFRNCSSILSNGLLLVIDYCLESNSYYKAIRSSGTLSAYKDQLMSTNILSEPGCWDLTAHLCLETLNFFAEKYGFKSIGRVKQGQALLSLGLSKVINSLKEIPSNKISLALEKRENLLRLVDPYGLGGFYWNAYEIKNDSRSSSSEIDIDTLFLNEPIN
tara:strand:+ start:25782 stop:26999 length:1218 start_codon:yes stop_codon:yes gene_type:complete